jgi:hypothetical protein
MSITHVLNTLRHTDLSLRTRSMNKYEAQMAHEYAMTYYAFWLDRMSEAEKAFGKMLSESILAQLLVM